MGGPLEEERCGWDYPLTSSVFPALHQVACHRESLPPIVTCAVPGGSSPRLRPKGFLVQMRGGQGLAVP